MSSVTEQKAASEPPSLLRRLRFPLIVVAIFGIIFAIPWVLLAVDFEIEKYMPFLMFTQWHGPAIAVLLIGLWWLFFCSFRWYTRLAGLAVAMLAVVGFYFSVREVELTMGRVGLVPRVHYVWEPSATERLAAFNQQPITTIELPAIDATIALDDFPRYRGARFDGVVAVKLDPDWTKTPPKLLWRRPSPGGYSGVAVAGNIAVTLEQRDAGETVVCYDRATGQELWAHACGSLYKDPLKMGDGPRSTPTIHDGHIFCLGATGELVCLTAEGKKVWATNVLHDAKAKNIKWGLSGSPLIVDDLVIAHAGIDEEAPIDSALMAYERANGKIRWRSGKRKAGYSSPQLATFAGKPQILLFDGEAVAGYDPKTGHELWQFPWKTMYEMNSIQPVVLGGDRVLVSSELDQGCAMLRIKPPDNDAGAWSVETVWHNKNLAARFANPVTDGKHIFGLHNINGILTCLDAGTGAVEWKGDREGPGQLLLTDGVLLVVNGKTGDVALFEANGTSCKELARHELFNDKTWNTPALAGDQLFVRNQREIACLKLPRR